MTLDELLAQCDPDAVSLSALDSAWLEMPDVGKEIIQDDVVDSEKKDDV